MKPFHLLTALFLTGMALPVQAGLWDTLFGPDNYWECLLEEMPGTLTYGGSMEKLAQCRTRFPNPSDYRPGVDIFGPRDYQGCLEKYLQRTRDPLARHSIQNACFRLFPSS